MKPYFLYVLLCGVFIGISCSSSKRTQTENMPEGTELPQQTITKDTFLLPVMPEGMTNPDERAKFLTMHYWDRFDFGNEKLITRPQITEQAFVDYINVLNYVSEDDAKKSIAYTLEKAGESKAMYAHFASLFEKYFNGPNSPFRNEGFYISVLEKLTKATLLSKEDESRYKFQLDMALKNSVGAKAANFNYTLASGKTADVYSINSDYLILMFSNPGCPACAATVQQIEASDAIGNALKRNSPNRTMLTVLTVYPDNDLNEWTSHVQEMPSQWHNAYDKGMVITQKKLYDIQAIPTLYLLDKDKKVILKDTSVEEIERFFSIAR